MYCVAMQLWVCAESNCSCKHSKCTQPIPTIYDCPHITPLLGHLSASADVRVPGSASLKASACANLFRSALALLTAVRVHYQILFFQNIFIIFVLVSIEFTVFIISSLQFAIENSKYRVHIKNKGWLPFVTGYNIKDYINGYAGNSNNDEIDALQIIE